MDKKSKHGLIPSSFISSTLILMSGTLIAQLMAVCISPIMARLYSTEAIGEYTLILTAVSMFGSVICLKYDAAVVMESAEKNVYSLIKLSCVVTLILSIFAGIGYALYCWITDALEMSFLRVALWSSLLLIFTGLGNILVSYNNRNKEYKLISSVNVVRETGRDILLICFSFLKFGCLGLLISQLVGLTAGLTRQAKSLRGKRIHWNSISVSQMKEVAIKYYKQPVFSVPANFINNFSYSSLNIMVSDFFGLSELAYYSMSFRMLGLPLTLVSTNMSKVFFERASREYNEKGDCSKSFYATTLILGVVAVLMVFVLIWLAPILFGFFFGDDWVVSGRYVQILAPMFGIRLVVSALTPVMAISKKQNIELLVQSLFVIVNICVYLFLGSGQNIEFFLTIISISYSVIYVVYYFIMLVLCKNRTRAR